MAGAELAGGSTRELGTASGGGGGKSRAEEITLWGSVTFDEISLTGGRLAAGGIGSAPDRDGSGSIFGPSL